MTEDPPRTRVVLADDHVLLLDALAQLLGSEFEVVAAVSDGVALIEAARTHTPAAIILDIAMPNLDGLGAAEKIHAFAPDCRLVFLTMHADPALAAQAFRHGAFGYVLKSAAASELTRAVRDALAGRRYLSPAIKGGDIENLLAEVPASGHDKPLTPREIEVVRLLVRGLSMKQIARELDITPRTVAFHKYNLMQQLGLKSNADLFQYAQQHGIVEVS